MADNIGVIRDPCIRIKPTSELISFLQAHKDELIGNGVPTNIHAIATTPDTRVMLKLEDIEWLNSFLRQRRRKEDFLPESEVDEAVARFKQNRGNEALPDQKTLFLTQLLQGCDFVLPKNEVIARNPVLAARVSLLEKQQAERDYQSMIRNVNSSRKFVVEDTMAYQMKTMNRHLIGVAQLILSIAAGFAFGFLGVQLMLGDLDFGFRLMLGISCAMIVAIAEMYFLIKHINEDYVRDMDKENTLRLSEGSVKAHSD